MVTPVTASSRRIPTVLGELHVRDTGGAGPAMVCWPSLLMDGRLWERQAQHFGARWRVLSIDPPGHGDSEPLRRHFTMDDCAQALVQILDALGIGDCVLLGNSWGGMMGGVFAASHPSRCRAAVLMNCTASAAPWRQRVEYSVMTGGIRFLKQVPGPLLARAVQAFTGPTSERTKPEVVERIRATVRGLNLQSVRWAIHSVVVQRTDRHAQLAQVRCPVLVVAGEEDRTFPVAETRTMADAIPGARFVVLPRIGHLAAMEAPEVVNAEVERFLAGL